MGDARIPGSPSRSRPSPPAPPSGRGESINLPTAMKLAGAEPLDIAIASAVFRRRAASSSGPPRRGCRRCRWARILRHDGQIQDVVGTVFGTSKSSLMIGAGLAVIFAVSDATSGRSPRGSCCAREVGVQAARNDSRYAGATAYFDVQQARGRVAGSGTWKAGPRRCCAGREARCGLTPPSRCSAADRLAAGGWPSRRPTRAPSRRAPNWRDGCVSPPPAAVAPMEPPRPGA